ncbi:MAG: LutB/LldF family L-lactate oxidation iron-sulfur protein [Acidobacteriota bacterium]
MINTAKINRNVEAALADRQLQRNLCSTLGKSVRMRDDSVAEVPNWEELSRYARDVKLHTLSRLDHYLAMLEEKITAQGGKVIWAETGQEAVQFIVDLARQRKIGKLVKSKSMLSEEIHLNSMLGRAQIESIETDLGEYIVQLAGETPSHLLAPALHKSQKEIADLFVRNLGMTPSGDVHEITSTARRVLREHFLSAPIGVTGVNFGVAETGTIVLVENEGNARLSVSVPQIHIALMGIEKVIPRTRDLAVFLKVLIRSATGQKMTSYISCLNGPRRPEELTGPDEFYLVLVDNGRSKILADRFLRQTLSCIRCGACQNICPVYQRIGGHAYESTYQGPIGAILTPQLTSLAAAPEHAFASSLCGACQEVCPVQIEIPHILLKLREQAQREKKTKASQLSLERLVMGGWALVMCSPRLYVVFSRWTRRLWRWVGDIRGLGRFLTPLTHWYKHREIPELAARSFRELYRSREE